MNGGDGSKNNSNNKAADANSQENNSHYRIGGYIAFLCDGGVGISQQGEDVNG